MESMYKLCPVGGGANGAHCHMGREICQEVSDRAPLHITMKQNNLCFMTSDKSLNLPES